MVAYFEEALPPKFTKTDIISFIENNILNMVNSITADGHLESNRFYDNNAAYLDADPYLWKRIADSSSLFPFYTEAGDGDPM